MLVMPLMPKRQLQKPLMLVVALMQVPMVSHKQ